MSDILLLMGLLVLSYIGSFVVGNRAIRGFGLPSGTEYLTLGFLIGPHLLGVAERSMLATFEPVAVVGLGWLAFVIGLDFGHVGARRVRPAAIASGALLAAAAGGAVGGAVWLVLARFPDVRGLDRLLMAGGIGAACAETTRHAVRWVSERHGARGPLADLLGDLADSDDLVPLLSTAVFFALVPAAHARADGLHFSLSLWQWVGITVALGLVIGLVAAVLLGREFRLHESWGVLLGASVLGIGVAARLGLSSLAAMFVAGVTLAVASRHRSEIRAMVVPTEQPVLLPVLLLAGANVHLDAGRFMPWVIAAAVLARLASKLAGGLVVRLAPRARRASVWLGASTLSSGTVAMTIGLAFAVRFPGRVGDAVLAAAAIATVFGEFVGPTALRRELTRAGEIEAPSAPEAAAVAEAGGDAPGAGTAGARPADASGAQAAVQR